MHRTTNNNPPFVLPSTTGFNNYEYNNNKVLENDNFSFNFALDRVYNNYEYDANGNMTKTTKYSLPLMQPSFPAILSSRNLYWNDSDQLQAMTDYSNSAHYFYNYAGDRTWKVVGAKITTTLSGIQRTYNVFNQSTYYLFPQVTITNSAYTKHIFAGTERICSKIGTGKSVDMLQLLLPPTAQITAKRSQQTNLMKRTFSNLCISNLNPPPIFLCAIVNGGNILSINLLSSSAAKITSTATEYEDLQYFYLSDHLGSSSWITDKDGNALQHLSYLPFGEVFANQKASGSNFDAEFKFLGKELDSETGYTKTDNRYYWAEAGVFLSVDPLCDKYPMLTPYNYAGNNPLIFRDPSGLDIDPTTEKNVANYVNPNSKQYSPAFAEQYNSLKNDKNAVYSFNYKSEKWRDNGETIVGNVTYNGTNDKGQYMIGINYTDDVSTTGLSTQSPLLEETFHAVQFSKGDYGYLAGDGSTFALDIHDEATAKVFAAQNTQTTKYGLEKKLLNSFNKGGIEGVVDFMKKSSSLSKVYNSLENVPIGNVLKSISGGNKPYFKANGQSAIQGLIMQRPK